MRLVFTISRPENRLRPNDAESLVAKRGMAIDPADVVGIEVTAGSGAAPPGPAACMRRM